MKNVFCCALGMIFAAAEAFAGSVPPDTSNATAVISIARSRDLLGCFVAAGGLAAVYNKRCIGGTRARISEANAAELYILHLSPAAQVAADVAAEGWASPNPSVAMSPTLR